MTHARVYQTQKGKKARKAYNTRPESNKIGNNDKYPCGESDDVHSLWVEAREQARLQGASGREVAEATLESLAHSGLTGEQNACLAFEIAISENIEQCAAILFSREVGLKEGAEYDQASDWTEATVRRIYPWYRGYEIACARE